MKILVVGETSYVGRSLESWLKQWPEEYNLDFVTSRQDEWKKREFSCYDVVFHAAAIVHQRHKTDQGSHSIYSKINRDLPVEVAKRARQAGVRQFIFMSSMSVYGIEGAIGRDIIITKDTPCKPTGLYGTSKLEAENELITLNTEAFHIAIIRAPMIYGPNCPGNYTRLKKLILKTPIFPLIKNQRSLLFIDNLSEFTRLLINSKESGVFFPQNREFVDTYELVSLIAKENSKAIYFSKLFSYLVLMLGNLNVVKKLFGNLKYDSGLSTYKEFNYCVMDFNASIKISETKG